MRKAFILALLLFMALPVFAQNATMVAVVSQRFEGGEMIYRRDNGDIYVISNVSGQWWRFSSSQYGRLSENRQAAPSNRISPANGFGRIWANNETIRRELGWATNVEIGFEMRFTTSNTGLLYLTRLNGIILELSSNNSWRTVSSIPVRDGASISRFVVSPSSIATGRDISISWEASGADFVQIAMTDSSNNTVPAALFDSMPLTGNLDWTVPETIRGDLVVTLWLVNHVDSTSHNCCYDWLTSLSRQIDIYQDSSLRIQTHAAYQTFEGGFMIWREDNGEVRVFYHDGSWEVIPESIYIIGVNNPYILPESCNPSLSVVNAFWAVWSAVVQSVMNCPTSNEQGYTLQISAEANGNFRYSLPDGRTITISANRWQ